MTADVLSTLYKAVDAVNMTLAEANRIPKAPDTVLLGADSAVESVALINLIVEAEIALEQDHGRSVNLGEARAPEGGEHPFRTLGSMASYIAARLGQAA